MGTELQRLLPDAVAPAHGELDILDGEAIARAVERERPGVLISTAAMNQVDLCEREPETAFRMNALATRYLAEACLRHGTRLVWFSTDFVFDGHRSTPYFENDAVNPLSVYGVSKAAGEMLVRATTPEHVIIRTSSLFSQAGSRAKGGNFVEAILSRLETGQPLSVIDDLTMAPTYAADLAAATVDIVESGESGTFHIANDGACTWYEFAFEIVRQAGHDATIQSRSGQAAGTAVRPPYSVLGSKRRPPLRSWKAALGEYLSRRP